MKVSASKKDTGHILLVSHRIYICIWQRYINLSVSMCIRHEKVCKMTPE